MRFLDVFAFDGKYSTAQRHWKIRKAVVLTAIAAFVFFLGSCSFRIPASSKVYVVGIASNYKDYGGGKMRLLSTTRDAGEFCMLYKHALDVKQIENRLFLMLDAVDGDNVLTDKNSEYAPTRENIIALLQSFQAGTDDYDALDSDDLLVLYYSGHGQSGSGSFVVPYYGAAGAVDGKDAYVSLSASEVADLLKALPCQVALICDSCHSGYFISILTECGEDMADPENDAGLEEGYKASFSALAKSSNVSGVFAAQAGEQSYSDESGEYFEEFNYEKHSLFSGFVLSRAMGWKHSDELFARIPSSASPSNGICTSLLREMPVYGTPLPDDKLKSMHLTLGDIRSSFEFYRGLDVYQKTMITMGPATKCILW